MTQPKIIIYTKDICPYCQATKEYFNWKELTFEEVDVLQDMDTFQELSAKHNWRSVPMIFIGDDFIGGYSDLMDLEKKWELNAKLWL